MFLASACGGSGSSDSDQVIKTVETFYRALADQKGDVVCNTEEGALVTSDGYDLTFSALRGDSNCSEALQNPVGHIPIPYVGYVIGGLNDYRFEDVTDVEVDGEVAHVQTEHGLDLTLVKDSGEWLIDNPGLQFPIPGT